MCSKPLIGIPADRRVLDPHPFHMVGEKYIAAVRDGAGAIPFLIPALGDSIDADDILSRVDGLLLTGSPSNVEPHHYNGDPSRPGTLHDSHRDATTLRLIERALENGVPMFAICRGYQELNVALGGSLHQHVHEQEGYHLHKENPDDPLDVQYGPSHEVHLVEGGLLRKLAGRDTVVVNSLHSQGVARLADGVTVEAVADDGLVEGFYVDGATSFALALQWHPEWKVTENEFSMKIFKSFGDACREYANQKTGVT
ncbi:MAG: gamma-glutamyl-gamma-aminobutyrate hydrolase family protein [Proteobacteria bacterium]|nr:gamma-glutamyl-gamma-aminobutyrate hydrolase family protein [Pseudomonadota bacterium]MDA0994424.1 gamma-glutamyl-gamma-aminobutyrate hydrolase family protein [Pseudomonadota bacterium]